MTRANTRHKEYKTTKEHLDCSRKCDFSKLKSGVMIWFETIFQTLFTFDGQSSLAKAGEVKKKKAQYITLIFLGFWKLWFILRVDFDTFHQHWDKCLDVGFF